MDTNEGLIFYRSFYNAINELEESDQLKIYQSISKYVFDNEEIQLNRNLKPIWFLIKPQLVANIQKRKNGKKGGRPKKETDGFDISNLDLEDL